MKIFTLKKAVACAAVAVLAISIAACDQQSVLESPVQNEIADVTYDNFADVMEEQNKVVLLWFWSEECPPSVIVRPDLQKLTDLSNDNLIIGSVDLDKYQRIGLKMQIIQLPSFVYVIDGREVFRSYGVRSFDQLSGETKGVLQLLPRD